MMDGFVKLCDDCWKEFLFIILRMKGFITVCLLLVMIDVGWAGPPQQPIIGIYTMDVDGPPVPYPENHTYIASSYVKNLEMAGAQVIPIFYHYSEKQLEEILGKINGVFFTGGNVYADIDNEWTQKFNFIVDYAKQQNRKGNPYPIWATCMGFQVFMYVTSGLSSNQTVFSNIEEQDEVIEPLKVIERDRSNLLKQLNEEEYNAVTTGEGVFFYHHRYCILKETYDRMPIWHNFWNLITTSKNKNGVEFISTIQSKEFPFFAVQYHPEKTVFEWRVAANRSYSSVSSSQKFINYFVNIARKNRNQFDNEEEMHKNLIYNYQANLNPLNNTGMSFVQYYVFDERNITQTEGRI